MAAAILLMVMIPCYKPETKTKQEMSEGSFLQGTAFHKAKDSPHQFEQHFVFIKLQGILKY